MSVKQTRPPDRPLETIGIVIDDSAKCLDSEQFRTVCCGRENGYCIRINGIYVYVSLRDAMVVQRWALATATCD